MFPTPIQNYSLKVNIGYRLLLIFTLIVWLLPLIAVMLTSIRTFEDVPPQPSEPLVTILDANTINANTIFLGGVNGKLEFDANTSTLKINNASLALQSDVSTLIENSYTKFTANSSITAGDLVSFSGYGIPGEQLEISLEDEIGAEIFSQIIGIGSSGKINFDIQIPRGSMDGTYILYLSQGKEEGITSFGIGQEPAEIITLKSLKLNYETLIWISYFSIWNIYRALGPILQHDVLTTVSFGMQSRP